MSEVAVEIGYKFEKTDATGRYVRGWASVVSVGGAPVEDLQGDIIDIGDLTKAAHEFVKSERAAKVMHDGKLVGEIVESVMVDDDFAKAVGATTDKRGWWIGMEINGDAARARVASGELRSFSIGGSGTREAV